MEIFIDGNWQTDVSIHFDSTKPTVVLVHGWQPGNLDDQGRVISTSIADYWTYATTALASRVNRNNKSGDINLLGWNWIAEASTISIDPFRPTPVVVPVHETINQGMLLAQSLMRLTPVAPVHLVGHSLGAKVASVAAKFTPDLPIDQVTVFDGPEIDTHDTLLYRLVITISINLADELRELTQRGVFIDSYSSAFGISYQEQGLRCADLNMKPPITFLGLIAWAVNAHSYPIAWYFGGDAGMLGAPVGTIDPNSGTANQPIGAGWSKVFNRTDTFADIDARRKNYTLGPDPDQPVNGLQFELFSRPDEPYRLVPVTSVSGPADLVTTDLTFTTGQNLQWFAQGNVAFTQSDFPQAVLTTDSPACLFSALTIPSGIVSLSFDFRFDNPRPDDRFTIFVNDQFWLAINGNELALQSDAFLPTGPIDMADFAEQPVTLTFVYKGIEPGRTLRLKNMKLTSKPHLPGYILTAKAEGSGGAIFPQSRTFKQNTTVTLTGIAQPGYTALNWSGPIENLKGSLTNRLVMDADKSVRLSFRSDVPPIFTCFGVGALTVFLTTFLFFRGTSTQ